MKKLLPEYPHGYYRVGEDYGNVEVAVGEGGPLAQYLLVMTYTPPTVLLSRKVWPWSVATRSLTKATSSSYFLLFLVCFLFLLDFFLFIFFFCSIVVTSKYINYYTHQYLQKQNIIFFGYINPNIHLTQTSTSPNYSHPPIVSHSLALGQGGDSNHRTIM